MDPTREELNLKIGLEPQELARRVVEAAGEKQASDIVLLDTSKVTTFADYFVICSAESERQIDAIVEDIDQTLSQLGVQPHHTEGNADSGWVLMDYSSVVVHVFSIEQRGYYKLDELWSKASTLVHVQ